ncbi:MAG: alpha-glucan phosphorylase [Candidatus Solibacter sp.]|nr:alpha-glucan phosphorylase [Candidatus Solibacter sp.]
MGNFTYTHLPAEHTANPITELALDLRWSWNHAADELWRELDPELWEATQNPWLILQSVSQERLQRTLAEPRFCQTLRQVLESKRKIEKSDAWYQRTHPNSPLSVAVYFSMEYLLSEALPVYAAGLGNVAGDQLKAASDLNVPVIAIGLLYQQGYFRQEIDPSGAQIARYPFNDPSQLPVRPLRDAEGEWVRMRVTLPGCTIWIRGWEAHVGRRKLYLLDTNDPANPPAHRCITGELYGGDSELRLRQETVLGMGGWRLLRALGVKPEVCHLNEGHAAFAVLERARSFMEDHNQAFDVALAATRAGNLFTTHTPVESGFDRFSTDLMRRYFQRYTEDTLKIPFRELMALGRVNPGDDSEPFNMAYLAFRGSVAVNGVSRLHGRVSRRLFQLLYPRWPEAEVPVGHVTNGVHVPTWDSAEADALWEKACGQERWRGSLEYVEDQVRCLEDPEIWRVRTSVRKQLVDFTRKRLVAHRTSVGASPEEIDAARRVFDPDWLTLGFARRFVEYKRPTMLLRDPERLVRILTSEQHPVQLILAGKAHPQDATGQALIAAWYQFSRRPEVANHVVFLEDYDMMLAQELVAGVDVWLNTPRRPWEASGTSGMKVLANGGLNASELDGWWAEAYAPDVGWAIGDGGDRGYDPDWDAAEANALYSLLEGQIIPEFYNRDEGIPRQWVARIRESMARLTPRFSTNRAVRQYAEELYHPLASAYTARARNRGSAAIDLLAWERALAAGWRDVRFGPVNISTEGGRHCFRVEVSLGGIEPADVLVELFADPLESGGAPFRGAMELAYAVKDRYLYTASVPGVRPAEDYTPRVIPRRDGVFIPKEFALIAWQK